MPKISTKILDILVILCNLVVKCSYGDQKVLCFVFFTKIHRKYINIEKHRYGKF